MASTSEVPANPEETPEVKETMYKTKLIQFFGRDTPIILQNDNGPCPLLAICNILKLLQSGNILLLRDKLGLNSDVTEVSQGKLLTLVAERLIDSVSNVNDKDVGSVENRHQTVADAIDLLPGLATGMDVNIKFRRIDDFEWTKEHAIFDLLDIPLYHGWLIDSNDSDTLNAMGSKSYNTVMEELVALETQSRRTRYIADWVSFETVPREADETIHAGQMFTTGSGGITARQGELIREFLKENATQLTRYGLFRLHYDLLGRKLCVFFRNNHFNTLFKFGVALYILVTDQGYINQPDVVWEKLTEINGDTEFVNSNFKSLKAPSPEIVEIGESEDESTNLASVFEYLARPDKTASSDKQFAKALEQQELEEPGLQRDPATFPSGFYMGPPFNDMFDDLTACSLFTMAAQTPIFVIQVEIKTNKGEVRIDVKILLICRFGLYMFLHSFLNQQILLAVSLILDANSFTVNDIVRD
ncbi:hypothetical protein L1987_02802 [Smallanthus sonchifolius]|uniref:Uncharacterized protein n=1 Tax=Smallanthus sonchifolius TaxID=185202 RepID=A0ACB9K8Y2_9ASTR|nr:hypothetical protein L1987_02802 [Smallanthus sonchifolius]